MQLAAGHGDGHRLVAPAAPELLQAVAGFHRADMGLGGTAGFAHHHHERGLQPFTQFRIGAAHAFRVHVVDEVERQAAAGLLQSADHQQRAQTGAANTDPHHVGKARATAVGDGTVQHLPGKCSQFAVLGPDLLRQLAAGCQRRCSQPVVANLPMFVAVGHAALLQCRHGSEGLLEAGLKVGQQRFAQPHAARIEPETQRLIVPEQAAEAIPELHGIVAVEGRKDVMHGSQAHPGNQPI